MARAQIVKKARKARPEYGIKKGDTYYWWKFRFGSIHYSKTSPTRSQLTQSGFLSQLYDIQDSFEFDQNDLEGSVEAHIADIECLRDECQDSLDNMPEHLQESSSSGQLLQERIEALDNWTSELEGIDLEIDEDLTNEEKEERINEIISELESCECNL